MPKNFTADDVRVVDPDTGAVYTPVAYVERMEDAYAAADLMLGRCGASTVMETAAVGLPAVFVPYPHGNGEQARNAALVVEAGGGLLLADADCTADRVATEIPALLGDAGAAAGNGRGPGRCCPDRRRGRAGEADAGGDRLMGLIDTGRAAGPRRARAGALHRHRRLGHERDRSR